VAGAGARDSTGRIIYVLIAKEPADEHYEFQFQMVEGFEALFQLFLKAAQLKKYSRNFHHNYPKKLVKSLKVGGHSLTS
jgi:hypothetical protein